MSGRSIVSNIHAVRVVCEAASVLDIPAAVLQVDLSRALDRVDHKFLFDLLEYIKSGDYLLSCTKICYNDISTNLMVNGTKTKKIPVKCSVRQGCPLSPLLSAVYLEPLCRLILADQSIQGPQLFASNIKVLAFSDDVSVIMTDELQLLHVLQDINTFCTVSGAQVNRQKSLGSWLGDWPCKPMSFFGNTWKDTIDGYLGVSHFTAKSTSQE